jgi:hypothetical protein
VKGGVTALLKPLHALTPLHAIVTFDRAAAFEPLIKPHGREIRDISAPPRLGAWMKEFSSNSSWIFPTSRPRLGSADDVFKGSANTQVMQKHFAAGS